MNRFHPLFRLSALVVVVSLVLGVTTWAQPTESGQSEKQDQDKAAAEADEPAADTPSATSGNKKDDAPDVPKSDTSPDAGKDKDSSGQQTQPPGDASEDSSDRSRSDRFRDDSPNGSEWRALGLRISGRGRD